MLITLNLCWIACKVLIPTFMATNSASNTDISMEDYFLEYQLTSDMLM